MNEWNPEAYYAPIPERQDGPDEPDLRTEDDDWWQALDEDKEEQERLRADIERKEYFSLVPDHKEGLNISINEQLKRPQKLDETNLDEQQRQMQSDD